MITLKLTNEEFKVLKEHFIRNFEYGVGGTFGDGEEYDDVKEVKIANKIINKLYDNQS